MKGVCPICQQSGMLERDHDHRNKLCRDRVCHNCNVEIAIWDREWGGLTGDAPDAKNSRHKVRILKYLSKWCVAHETTGVVYRDTKSQPKKTPCPCGKSKGPRAEICRWCNVGFQRLQCFVEKRELTQGVNISYLTL